MQIAGFTLDQVIHAAGETVVARATDAGGRPVVLKLLDSDQPAPELLARWRHEFGVLRSLDAPEVIRALALQPVGRSLALVLEDFGHCNLAQLIEHHPLDLAERLALAIQLTQALSAVHSAGLIHCDVAPKNVLVDPGRLTLRLCDFGLATRLSHEARRSPEGFPHGTLAYVAPEQTGRTNLEVDQRSDFYSLGATLYELFSGQPPFADLDAAALLHAQLALQPLPLRERDPSLPEALSALVAKLLAKQPDARYQSSFGLLHDLRALAEMLQRDGHIGAFTLATRDLPERLRLAQCLLGRERQCEALLEAFEQAAQGAPGLVLVSGSSGIGKTALVAEVHQPVAARQGYFLRGKCDQYQRHRPYAALADAFQALVQQLAIEGRADYWRSRLQSALGVHAAAVAALVPALPLLIGPLPPLPELPAADAEARLHLAFDRFVAALCCSAHPLLVFLDDLQWADAPTLRLLEHLLTGPAAELPLLVVGALREQEVGERHPLRALQAALTPRLGERLTELHLGPLPGSAVQAWLALTLRCPPEHCAELAHLCADKTGANPFFLGQFLRHLHEQGELHFDRERGTWAWDLAAIERRDLTDNVVQMMLAQLRSLPAATQGLLAQAAGLGGQFRLAELMSLGGRDAATTAMQLWPALQADLVQPLSEAYRFEASPELLAGASYRFLHDRVQQAAYELTPADERAALQLNTGRRLLASLDETALAARLFDVLDAVGAGLHLVTEPAERTRLRALHLRGGLQAKAAAAYPTAARLLRQALALQPEPEELPALYQGLAEALYLSGDFDAAEALYGPGRAACPEPADQARLLGVQADQYHLQGRFDDAFGVLREALALLDHPFPATDADAWASFPAEVAAALARLQRQPAQGLLSAAEITEPEVLLLQRLQYALTYSTYQTGRFGSFVVDATRMLRTTLAHGQSDLSAIACVAFVTAMSVAKQPYADCYAMGELALRLAEQRGNRYVRVTLYQYFNAFYQHWGAPLADSFAPQDNGLALGREGVNPLAAGYCALLRCVNRWVLGTPLAELAAETARSLDYLQSSHQANTEAMLRQGVLWPLQQLLDPAEGYPAADMAAALAAPPGIPWALASAAALRNAYILDDELGWRALAGRLDLIGQCLPDSPSWVDARWFTALGALRYEADDSAAAAHAELFETWALGCPANFEAPALLLRAELARRAGEEREAMDLFARAIEQAGLRGQGVIEAVANECYARFWQGLGQRQLAKQFIREAYYQWRRWGAALKCRGLEAAWPQEAFRVAALRDSGASLATRSSLDGGGALDLQSLYKAQQLMAQEIHLDALLRAMTGVLIEHAGADRGAIVLVEDGRLSVQTSGRVVAGRRVECERLGLSWEQAQALLPQPLIEYCKLTRERLVVNHPAQDSRFARSPYWAQHGPNSALCLPVLSQGALVALVYLENSLLEDAFTAQRLQTLELLAGQAAISLINARLVSDLEHKVAERTEALRQMTMKDGLTGIANRRAFDERLAMEWRRSQRQAQPLALLLIDIDHFKAYNDHYGHVQGDACIRAVAQALHSVAARATDLAARYGGEEFALLLPQTTIEGATRAARASLAAVAALALTHERSDTTACVSVSVGVASLLGSPASPEHLIRAADAALYRAKRGGRARWQAQSDDAS